MIGQQKLMHKNGQISKHLLIVQSLRDLLMVNTLAKMCTLCIQQSIQYQDFQHPLSYGTMNTRNTIKIAFINTFLMLQQVIIPNQFGPRHREWVVELDNFLKTITTKLLQYASMGKEVIILAQLYMLLVLLVQIAHKGMNVRTLIMDYVNLQVKVSGGQQSIQFEVISGDKFKIKQYYTNNLVHK